MPVSYVVQSRQNSNLQLAGVIDDFSSLDMTLRHNNYSEWTMQIDRRSAHMANLIPVSSPLGMNGNGIVVTRDYGNGTPQVILSGPITHIDYTKSSQIATLKGYDDTIWLQWRGADTVPASYPYSTAMLARSPLCYYRLGESVGTTATDASGHANGTYSGSGVAYAQAGLIEDTATSVKTSGSTGSISIPTTSFPTGNAPWAFIGWGFFTSLPAGFHTLFGFGTNVANEGIELGTNAGKVYFKVIGGTAQTGVTVAGNSQPFMLGVSWDGTTMKGYFNGLPEVTQTPGALNIVLGTAVLGSTVAGTQFFNNTFQDCAFVASALSDADFLALYQIGRSRLAYDDHDTRSGLASTEMIAYVNVNAGPGSLVKRQVANLTMAADPSVGGQVTGAAREDILLDLLKNLALQSGDNIGFYVRQTLGVGANTMAFTTFAPRDQTSNAIFSDEIGNLQDYSFSLDWPTATVITVGGSGQQIDRNFLEVPDAASIAAYGRVEGFVNATQSGDYQTMLNNGQAQLLTTKAATSFSFVGVDTAGLQYQRDYGPGDKVTVYVEGQTIQEKIREIQISLSKGSGAGSPDEVITPAIGTPDTAQAVPGALSQLGKMIRQQQRNQTNLGRLERYQ